MKMKKIKYLMLLSLVLNVGLVNVKTNAEVNTQVNSTVNVELNLDKEEKNVLETEQQNVLEIEQENVLESEQKGLLETEQENVLETQVNKINEVKVKEGAKEATVILLNNDRFTGKKGWVSDSGKWYYIENSGVPKTGWLKEGSVWYYLRGDGEMATGWQLIGSTYYYLNSSGAMATGWKAIDGKWYYLYSSGAMAKGWFKEGNTWYYLRDSGEMATGWQLIGSTYYYLNSSGAMATGWKAIDGNWYYLYSSGAMAKGWFKEGNAWYYLRNSGEMATGLQAVGSTSYYLNSSGVMGTGWKEISGKWYYFYSSGAMAKGWFKEGNTWYYLKDNGEMATGWQVVGTTSYYLNSSGAMQTGWKQLSGEWYYLESSGAMKTGLVTLGGKTYLLRDNGAMATKWGKYKDSWYYLNSDGAQKKGWLKINDDSYYLDDQTGERLTYQWKVINGVKYWFNINGTMAKGDTIIDGQIHSFDNSGKYIGLGNDDGQIYVEFISVGDADAMYMELPNGDDVLIDGGESWNGPQIVEFLKGKNLDEGDGVDDIDYIINTHPHSDHIGGLVEVFKNFQVNNFYYPYDIDMKKYEGFEGAESIENHGYLINCMNYCYQFYNEVLELSKKQGTKVYDTTPGSYVDKDNIIKFIQPDKKYKQNYLEDNQIHGGMDYSKFNNDSAVIYVNYGDFQMLLASDIESETERDMLNMGLIPNDDIEILKIPHHGYDSSSTYEFLEKVSPEFGIMSRSQSSFEWAKNSHVTSNLEKLKIDTFEVWRPNGVKVNATKKSWNIQK